jgi:tellurite resistance protein TehA-like permease
VGFFTTVAGTCVLGSQFLLIFEGYQTAFVLWIAGTLLWLIFTYSVFTALMVKETKPPLAEGINGGWLVAVVATQSVSNLSGLLARHLAAQKELVLFVSLSLWLCGAMLYIWIISIIFYRYLFFKLAPSDLTPPYWVNMGAMAISTLAGTTLIANAGEWQFLAQLRPFLAGFTVLFWATATWWIPMLLILGCWRHLYKRFKIAYDPLYWGAVFPLGMYVACTFQLARVTELRVLALIPRYFIYVALAAWTLTFSGLLRSMYSGMRKGKEAPCAAGS